MAERMSAVAGAFASGKGERAWLDERLGRWVVGPPEQAREIVHRFAEAGVERIMLQDMLAWDLDMIDVMGEVLVGRI
jgi:hypothetical protein